MRRLISSNSHHTGAESRKSRIKFLRDRVQSELPIRLCTRASTTKMYPSQSGKNRYAVRTPGIIQFSGQQTATRISPTQPRAGHSDGL
ncbi:MAG: hypothetical protein DME98_02280 [Verrucomicrobia bacterium]|nr:MAG: hypothetical protein DME98_02280 [Verrucomicrobiota bacterium]